MHYTLPTKHRHAAGFTLVEILIIAPIVVLMIGAFVGLMVSMVGDVLTTRDQTTLTYNTQSALDRIEQDTRLSTQFLVTSGAQTAPQGSNTNFTGTAAFTNSTASTLILSELATDRNPTDPSRALVYYVNQPNPCGASQRFNRVMLTKVIYFIKSGSLWRRTILPDSNTEQGTPDTNSVCTAPWQKDSCSPGYAVATRCETNDEEVMKNVNSMNVSYYGDPSDTSTLAASEALNASAIGVTINASVPVAGVSVTNSASMRASKLNSIDTTQPAPAAPAISHTFSTPNSVQFSWPGVPSATSYQIAYKINSGQWTNQTLDANTVSFTVAAERNDVVSFKAAAFNFAGGSTYSTDSATMPDWTPPPLQSGWSKYQEDTYSNFGYTRTSEGVVVLKGLIGGGSDTQSVLLATLPEGYRPSNNIIFTASTFQTGAPGSSGIGRIDVYPTGEIKAFISDTSWLSLDGINFLPAETPYPWTNLTFQNGWVNYGGSYTPLQATKDTLNRVHLQGLIKPGTTTSGLPIANLPTGYQPALDALIPSKDTGTTASYYDISSTNKILARGIGTSFMNVQAMYCTTACTGWTNLTLQNGWVVHSATFSSPQYIKSADGIVMVKGLIKGGDATSGKVIATLPVGYRPAKQAVFQTEGNGPAYARVDVLANGNIVSRSAISGWTSLDTIQFVAEQ